MWLPPTNGGARHIYIHHLGRYYALPLLVWDAFNPARPLKSWHRLQFIDGNPWNTRLSNLRHPVTRPRGRPRKHPRP